MNGLALGRSLRSCGTKLGHYWCASNPDCGLISPPHLLLFEKTGKE